ncbi:hypothetical protein [Actinoallomurus rhizosphaericola]|uniref:hypothetical protein n=1 Tax=Actinoallomurus rhizosphaericola TaxID=2952536 RepID=UPI002092F886|nr:hypothetical protein [Actinoallomurus rhizosphaericola]MCO5998511.1 hypothetical protein [Actinoallomurus rhizosphaericola]
MAAERRLALHAMLPDRYAHLEVLASTIDHRGRLAALVADPAQGFVSVPHFSVLRPPPRYDATALICDGPEIREIPLNDLDLWFTHIDTRGDGVVLAAARCERQGIPYERYGEPIPEHELRLTANIRVIDGEGQTRASFYAGDGIEQLMTDPQGNIWASYFDESSYWTPNPDGTRSYQFMVGLVRWDCDGGPSWMVADDTPGVDWCDCYALNVGRELVHACPYTKFPLVELDANSVRAVTPNPVTRCAGLAVSGSELAFLDQDRADGGFRWEIRRARREGGVVIETDREKLMLPGGRQPKGWARGKIGRDGSLWLHEDDHPRQWYRYEIDT